jgi:hypothetical protein
LTDAVSVKQADFDPMKWLDDPDYRKEFAKTADNRALGTGLGLAAQPITGNTAMTPGYLAARRGSMSSTPKAMLVGGLAGGLGTAALVDGLGFYDPLTPEDLGLSNASQFTRDNLTGVAAGAGAAGGAYGSFASNYIDDLPRRRMLSRMAAQQPAVEQPAVEKTAKSNLPKVDFSSGTSLNGDALEALSKRMKKEEGAEAKNEADEGDKAEAKKEKKHVQAWEQVRLHAEKMATAPASTPIRRRLWNIVHNAAAHPVMAFFPNSKAVNRFHDYTADKMGSINIPERLIAYASKPMNKVAVHRNLVERRKLAKTANNLVAQTFAEELMSKFASMKAREVVHEVEKFDKLFGTALPVEMPDAYLAVYGDLEKFAQPVYEADWNDPKVYLAQTVVAVGQEALGDTLGKEFATRLKHDPLHTLEHATPEQVDIFEAMVDRVGKSSDAHKAEKQEDSWGPMKGPPSRAREIGYSFNA